MAKRLLLLCLISLLPLQFVHADDGRLLATVRAAVAVRSGPATTDPVLGSLRAGGKLYVSGRNATGDWLYFLYYNKPAWVTAEALQMTGAVEQLPVMGTALADIRLKGYTVDPPTPRPGQPFAILASLENRGGSDAGLFRVAATFPSGFFALVPVAHLASGEAGIVRINAPGERVTGKHTMQIVIDVDRQIPQPKADRMPEVTFWVDRAYVAQSSIRLPAFSNVDLFGGKADLAFDGQALQAMPGATLTPLASTLKLGDIHYDLVANAPVAELPARLTADQLFAVHTVEGYVGVVRVNRWSDGDLLIDYFIYSKEG